MTKTIPCYEDCDGIMELTPIGTTDDKYAMYLKIYGIKAKYVCNKCGAIIYGERLKDDNNTD